MIRSCGSTWARSRSSGRTGPEPSTICGTVCRVSADRFNHAQTVRPDRPRTPDDGKPASALAVCDEGLSFDPDDAELLFRKAVVHRTAAQPAEAEDCWRRILTLRRPDQFCSVDQGIYGHLTLRNLAVLAEERGDAAEAVRLWVKVFEECPRDPEATARLQRLGQ